MTTKDVADLFITSTGKIEFYWNFYTVTVLALIGWLVSTKRALVLRVKVLVTIGYLVFVAMNVLGLYGAYTFAEALRLDLLAISGSDAETLENARDVLSERSFNVQKRIVVPIHLLVGSFVRSVVRSAWRGSLRGQLAALAALDAPKNCLRLPLLPCRVR